MILLVAFPFGVSRAGMVALVVGLLVYAVFLTAQQRFRLLIAGIAAMASAYVFAPAVVGTLIDTVTGSTEDGSVQARLNDYPVAVARVALSPWLGGAPVNENLRLNVLDNQWLLTLVTSGILGVVSLVILWGGGATWAARTALSAQSGSMNRSFNGALAATLVAAAVSAGTFDYLAFQQVTFLTFLLLGLVGSYRRQEFARIGLRSAASR
ncbi:O-antigen ligase family protein [Modestobacter sp. VKM Ac-2979]|uniref:O-antigen ligase family protein n=1 Tax=unclassified Modestobacter TaxID=2643866 RepID=UPI0022AB65CC|nr:MULTISPECIES: O-antigen ligase family protein [unclassified Modestobacter]MCZ2813422.1 O-antigen ligase family protein [Modestobacter sp. VKM Ac-2979]MCZ2842386.1 O-antigen ligase family protein [Modestobacter sp. VKM Ac-2980]